MGKAKKIKPHNHKLKPYPRTLGKSKPHPPIRKPAPAIPFGPTDRILLVGEGDFSFALSLLATYGCTSLVATSYDKKGAVISKYPQARGHLQALESEEGCRVIHGVDATKLGKSGATYSGGKEIKKGGFDRVVFNFPHVGGLTKDVNRQVRHNQELLVGFFNAAMLLLAARGSIIITIFDGEPYELWNIRSLARHVGLKVARSFKFQASAYPEYQHARTLGNIEGGGGWNGTDRPARTFVFKMNDGSATPNLKGKNDSSDEDSRDE